MSSDPRDRVVAEAFDGQAAKFERAPLQSNAAALGRLVEFARLPPATDVLDAGCGPGLVAEAFLEAGHEVVGVDLSAEMVRRARGRCAHIRPGRSRTTRGRSTLREAGRMGHKWPRRRPRRGSESAKTARGCSSVGPWRNWQTRRT